MHQRLRVGYFACEMPHPSKSMALSDLFTQFVEKLTILFRKPLVYKGTRFSL